MRTLDTAALALLVLAGCFTADNTAPLPGDARNFDPVAHFAAMAAYAGPDARLVSMRAMFVRTDGTLDLEADYHPYVDAAFVIKATPEDAKAQGPVAPGSGFAAGDAIRLQLSVRAPATYHVQSGGSEWDERHLGMDRRPGGKPGGSERFAEPPRCGFAALWSAARQRGAPDDVVANIDYAADGYTFAANGRDFRMRFAPDCKPVDADR